MLLPKPKGLRLNNLSSAPDRAKDWPSCLRVACFTGFSWDAPRGYTFTPDWSYFIRFSGSNGEKASQQGHVLEM